MNRKQIIRDETVLSIERANKTMSGPKLQGDYNDVGLRFKYAIHFAFHALANGS